MEAKTIEFLEKLQALLRDYDACIDAEGSISISLYDEQIGDFKTVITFEQNYLLPVSIEEALND